MNILITDGLTKEGIEILTEAGFQVTNEKLNPEELLAAIPDYDALIVRSATNVTRDVIGAGRDRLKIIGRAGVEPDTIDVEAATANGIIVKIAPHGNTNATAELAMGLMLNISRNIPQSYDVLKDGSWEKKRFGGVELTGKTVGIVGCGRIGQRLAEMVQGFMDRIGYDPYKQEVVGIRLMPSLEDLLRQADYVSLHLPKQEIPVIGERELKLMKETAYLINTSRGPNVDEDALYHALKEGWIAGAAVDVYREGDGKEGQPYSNRLFGLSNFFIGTPHIGALTEEAQRKTGIEMAEVIRDYLLKGDFGNAVNVEEEISTAEKPTYQLFVHHIDKPGVFARIDEILAARGVNIREIRSNKMDGNANTVYLLTSEPTQDVIEGVRALEDVHGALR